jgi:putative transposase
MRKQKPSSRSVFVRPSERKVGRPLERKVKLKADEKKQLAELLSRGRESVRVIKRAMLLRIMDGGKSAGKAAEAVGAGKTTAQEIRDRYFEGGLKRALWEAPRPGKERVFTGRKEQQLVAMLCGPSPLGRARWTVRLAAEEAVERGIVVDVGRETVRVVMNNHALKPWREKNVVRPGDNAGIRGEDGGRS